MSTQFHALTVKAKEQDTTEAVILSFDVPSHLKDEFKFQQGQYLTLRTTIEGEDLRRSYSICAGIDDGVLRVGVRKVPGGRFSTWVNEQLKAGQQIQVMPPQGNFFVALNASDARHYLGLAGGSGITPILSIMKTVLKREPQSRFTLIYGNRKQSSTMFLEELEDLKNQFLTRVSLHHVLSDEHQDAPLNQGIMNQAKITEFMGRLIDPRDIDHAFICGPYQMNDEAEAALLKAGLSKERIHIERFGTPTPVAGDAIKSRALPGDAADAQVTIVRDGVRRSIRFKKDDPSILDAAASAGLDVPFSCKSGVCSTCRAKLLEGKVRMDKNFALEPHEVEAGYILTCQSHPLTPEVVISFDDR